MARFGRNRAATTDSTEEWPADDQPVLAEPAPDLPAAPVLPAAPIADLPANRLRGNEITYGYVVGVLVAAASVIMLTVTGGKGAPLHPQPIWAVLGVVFGVATVISVRWSNRLLTAMLAIVGGFVAGQARTPTSLAGVKFVALLAPVVFGVLIFRRQSKADRARRVAQSGATAAERRARRNAPKAGEGKGRPVPGRPQPSGRYTPPKARRRQR